MHQEFCILLLYNVYIDLDEQNLDYYWEDFKPMIIVYYLTICIYYVTKCIMMSLLCNPLPELIICYFVSLNTTVYRI